MVNSGLDAAIGRTSRGNRRIFATLACFVVAAVAVVSFLPFTDKRVLHTSGRLHSWGHLMAFGAVAYLLAKACRSVRARTLLFLGALIFGLGIEFGEHLVFHNGLEWKDVLVDTLGVICGTLTAMSRVSSAPEKTEPASQ